ncbi:hypothetical protein [Citrobacter freundii]
MISLMHAATSDKWSRNLERGDIPVRLCNMRKKARTCVRALLKIWR